MMSLLSACTAKSIESVYIGSCKQLIGDQVIWEAFDNIYVGEFIFSSFEKPHLLSRGKARMGIIDSGTQLQISQVLQGANGSYGPFLRVQVEVLAGQFQGMIADLPACVPYHPKPQWVDSCDLEPNKLSFNESVLTDCLPQDRGKETK